MIEAIFSLLNRSMAPAKLVACHLLTFHSMENKSACATRNGCQDPLRTCSSLRRQMGKNSNQKNYLNYLEAMPFAQDRKFISVKAKQTKQQNGCQDSSKVTGVCHTRKAALWVSCCVTFPGNYIF